MGGRQPPGDMSAPHRAQKFARDDVALDFRGALPDPFDPCIAPDPFQRQILHQPHTAMDLDRLIGDHCQHLTRLQLGHRHVGLGDTALIEAPCRIFESQEAVQAAFKAGELDRDVIVVVRFQGPRANGMPELHKLTPALGVLQDRGYKVALVTDGRMSGASGKVPAAIHLTPEALGCGPLSRLQDGDIVRLCAEKGILETTADLSNRTPAVAPTLPDGTGRELFAMMRLTADGAEQGASAMLAAAGL